MLTVGQKLQSGVNILSYATYLLHLRLQRRLITIPLLFIILFIALIYTVPVLLQLWQQ